MERCDLVFFSSCLNSFSIRFVSPVFRDYEDFLQDLEADAAYREGVNIYKDTRVGAREDMTTDDEGDVPKISLEEMLDDLNLTDMDEDGDVNVLGEDEDPESK